MNGDQREIPSYIMSNKWFVTAEVIKEIIKSYFYGYHKMIFHHPVKINNDKTIKYDHENMAMEIWH